MTITRAAEELINVQHSCLNHGSITLLDVMGCDTDIEQAARVSFTGGESDDERTLEQTTGLLRYLMRHRHTTPFEMGEFKFRVVLPIFVERQFIRHRTASTNELSGRYQVLPDLYYVPTPERLRKQSESNKQGSSDEQMDNAESEIAVLEEEQVFSRKQYIDRIDRGMAKELARINVPVSQYTAKVWKMDLHNLFHFLSLRVDSHAQEEIRVYANYMAQCVAAAFPICWEAFEDFRFNAMSFSAQDLYALACILRDHPTIGSYPFDHFKTKREAAEFKEKLGRLRALAPR